MSARTTTTMARMRGFSLIELMVALVLGLLLTTGALGIFLSARQAFRTTEELSRVQESARAAFELMARDAREAGNNHCASNLRSGSVISGASNSDLVNWNTGVRGISGGMQFINGKYSPGGGVAARVAGGDALEIHSNEDLGIYVTTPMTSYGADLQVNAVPTDVKPDDYLIVCDFRLSTLFVASAVTANTVSHSKGSNTSGGFLRDTSLASLGDSAVPASAWHLYGTNASVTRVRQAYWFIGNNSKGGKSLYRAIRAHNASPVADEIAEGVSAMALTYLAEGQNVYVRAESIADWSKVKAVRVELSLEGESKTNAFGNQGVLARKVTAVLAFRSRNL